MKDRHSDQTDKKETCVEEGGGDEDNRASSASESCKDEDNNLATDNGSEQSDGNTADNESSEECVGSLSELEQDLLELKKRKRECEAESFDENIAELDKLILEFEAAENEYILAYPELKEEEARLASFKQKTEPDLKCVLQQCGVDEVNSIVCKVVAKINDAEDLVFQLKGVEPKADKSSDCDEWCRGEVGKAENTLAEAEKEFTVAENNLLNLKKITEAILARHKNMQKLEEEIPTLGRSGHPATAYWLLTQCTIIDNRKHILLDGAEMFSGMIEPEVIEPNVLKEKLSKAWREFQCWKKNQKAAQLELKAKQTELKEAETRLADLKKNFRKTIMAALAEWELARINPNV